MAAYPHLVQLAWDTVERLVADWQRNPHYWEREIDIQAELRSRLALVYSVLGKDKVIETRRVTGNPQRSMTYKYSRVACEPTVRYEDTDGKTYRVQPDLVVWDDLPDPRNSPDDNGERWPILWGCEIKYKDPEPTEWDVEKLGYLLDQRRIQYGCWITFTLDRKLKRAITQWDKVSHGTRLWKCAVRAPEYPPML